MDLQAKTVLLTGGTNGIGRELALQLQAKGTEVITTGRNAERVTAMRRSGFEVIEADLSDAAGVDGLLAAMAGRDIDALINNAGQLVDHEFRTGPSHTSPRAGTPDPDASDAAIYANLTAPIRLIVGLMETLKSRPEAAIVNVTSGLAIAPAARASVYCATKAGLRFYTLGLRTQLKDTNIHVIEALPPVVDTQMNEGRDAPKMSAQECARRILVAIEKNKAEANIGITKALRVVEAISPALAKTLTLRL
ncbi:MAG: SDR family NAD(P)-dependent oxidoreductase [Pseudomonadota bacterium]